MKKYITYMAAVGFALIANSCNDFLDKEYDASLSETKVFGNTNLTRQFLTNIYTNLPDGFAPLNDTQFTGASRDCMTDNSTSWWSLHFYDKIASDIYTAADHPLLGFWYTDLYGIRKCNVFLKNARSGVVGNAEKEGDDNRLFERYRAEALLLRALFHFDLIGWFGDAPVIAEDEAGTPIVFDLSDAAAMNMERTPAAQALEWVAAQCDLVKDVLPFRYADETSNWGRVNGATAYALKSRALLYRASPLHNPGGDRTLWKNAADAAKAFIEENAKQARPYRLYDTGKPESDYYDCFTTNPVYNDEFILCRSVWNTNQIEQVFLPPGFSGSFTGNGRTNPTQNFVDCFETLNGKTIENDASYNPQKPYENRDPRLNQIVFHQGSVWGRADKDEQRRIDVRFNSETDMGADYKTAFGGTLTGYYLKKYVNNISAKEPSTFNHAWILFRYAEILLNAAEAVNEAEGPANAYAYINAIRSRAGMPAYSGLTAQALQERIRNERRIELCFEDHRFFDLRRWKAYEGITAASERDKPYYQQIYNLYGVSVTGTAVNPLLTYGPAQTHNLRVFKSPKNYFFPIPNDEVKRAPKLGQNKGWELGD